MCTDEPRIAHRESEEYWISGGNDEIGDVLFEHVWVPEGVELPAVAE